MICHSLIKKMIISEKTRGEEIIQILIVENNIIYSIYYLTHNTQCREEENEKKDSFLLFLLMIHTITINTHYI